MAGKTYNDFSVDDMLPLRVVLMDVVGGNTHDNHGTCPLHETKEEQDEAEGRSTSGELVCHCLGVEFKALNSCKQ